MTGVEILLLLIGIGVFVASFLVPVSKEQMSEEERVLADEEIKNLVTVHVEQAASDIRGSADEAVQYAVEKTERSLERLTNEKIMAVNEYADTVLSDIHKNHEEVIFLYDLLNDKQVSVKNISAEVDKTVKYVSKTVSEVKQTADEAEKKVGEAFKSVQEIMTAKEELAAQNSRQSARRAKEEAIQEAAAWQTGDAGQEKAAEKPEQAGKRPEASSKTKAASSAKRTTKKKSAAASDTDGAAADRTVMKQSAGEDPAQTPGGKERNKNDVILALHKEGKSNMAIARELGLGIGEVKLVIDLFNL